MGMRALIEGSLARKVDTHLYTRADIVWRFSYYKYRFSVEYTSLNQSAMTFMIHFRSDQKFIAYCVTGRTALIHKYHLHYLSFDIGSDIPFASPRFARSDLRSD